MNTTGHNLERSQNATPATYEANNQQNSSSSMPTPHTSGHDVAAVGDALFDFVQGLKGKSLNQSMWAPKGRASRAALPSSWGTTYRPMSPRPMASTAPMNMEPSACKDLIRSDSKQGPLTSKTDASTQTDAFLVLSLLEDERSRQNSLQQVQVKPNSNLSPPTIDRNPRPSAQLVGCRAMRHQQNQLKPNQAPIPDEKMGVGLRQTPADLRTDKTLNQGSLDIAKDMVSPSERILATRNAPSSQGNLLTKVLTIETTAPSLGHADPNERSDLNKEKPSEEGRTLREDCRSSPAAGLVALPSGVEQLAKENQDPPSTARTETKSRKCISELPSLHQLGGFDPTAYGKPKAHRTYTAEDRTNQVYFASWGAAEPRDRPSAQVRTVTLTRLPRNATSSLVSSLVFGGALELIQMRSDDVASVRFLNGDACRQYADKTEKGIVLNKGVEGREHVVLTFVAKEVDVIGGKLQEWINQGRTRCVKAVGVSDDVRMDDMTSLAKGKSGGPLDRIEDSKNSLGHRVVIFRFTKIDHACNFHYLLRNHEEWEHCNINYCADPCAEANAPRIGSL